MVSLITTIVISILLMIITTSMVALMIGEQRQATDANQSIRAFYAAEAGVEDALLKLSQNPTLTQDCAATEQAVDAPNLLYVTCQKIYSTSNRLTGELGIDEVLQLEVDKSFQSMSLSWEMSDPVGPTGPYYNPSNFEIMNPGQIRWNHPAVMELTDVEYNTQIDPSQPNCGNNIAAICMQTIVVSPGGDGQGNRRRYNIQQKGANPNRGSCNEANGTYKCTVLIRNFDNNGGGGHVIRLKSRYAGTNYQLQFFPDPNGNGAPRPMPDQNATVEVTARAGDIYRRVVAKVPIRSGVASGVDYVLYSDTDITKNCNISILGIEGDCGQ